MFLSSLIVGALIVVAAVAFLLHRAIAGRRPYEVACTRLRDRWNPQPLSDLRRFICDQVPATEEFWLALRGIRGLTKLLHASTILVRLIQANEREGHITPEAAAAIYRYAWMQLWFSVWSLPESLICMVWRDLPHAAAHAAVQLHHNLSLRVITLCSFDGAPECISNLEAML